MKIKTLKQTIDLNLLDEAIDYCKCNSGEDVQYLIMNCETKYMIIKSNNFTCVCYAKYRSIPIAICDKLDTGDIELI